MAILDHPLMRNNITREDIDWLISYLQGDDPRLSSGSNVLAFEKEWSNWLGVGYSVFVNSGSSANLITMATLRKLTGEGEIIVPPLTWVSDIASVLQAGFVPVFADINPYTLAMDTDQIVAKITDRTRAVFLTHVQGLTGLTGKLLAELDQRGVPLIEDVCESHGATFKGRKLGTYGLMSNFSFYYAHHMSTIEGGMVCTDDHDIYQTLRMYRAHGLVRESSDNNLQDRYNADNSDLNQEFIFAFPAYNVRNTEIGAVIGRNQLKRLDKNIETRNRNQKIFFRYLDNNRFRTDFVLEGSSSYAFNIVLKDSDFKLRDRIEEVLRMARVEFRRGSSGGGNQMRQPYLRKIVPDGAWNNYPEVEHIHFFGWYIGNYPELPEGKIMELCQLLNHA